MVAPVVRLTGRNNQNVRRLHFTRPMCDPVCAARQHAERDAFVTQHAPGTHADGERSN